MTVEHDPRVNVDALNDIGRRRIREGLRCFGYLENPDQYTAVSMDWGLSARGATLDEAKRELRDVLTTFIELMSSKNMLEDVLNQPDNAAAVREFQALKFSARISNFVLAIVHRFRSAVRPMNPVNEYRENSAMVCPA